MTYTYGYNISTDILSEYATKLVCIRILEALLNSNSPTGLRVYDGGDLGNFVNTNYKSLLDEYRADREAIERKHFPQQKEVAFEVI